MEAHASAAVSKLSRLSRYRSVRKAAEREESSTPPQPASVPIPVPESCTEIAPQNDQIKRAPSRYRRPSKPIVQDVLLPVSEKFKNLVTLRTQIVLEAGAQTEAEAESEEKDVVGSPRQRSEAELSAQTAPCLPDRYKRHSGPPQYSSISDPLQRSNTVTGPGAQSYNIPKSFHEARAQARKMLDSEHSRMRRLKDQQQQVEKERKARLEQELSLQTVTEPPQYEAITTPQPEEKKTKRPRRWIIGRINQNKPLFGGSQTVDSPQARALTKETLSEPPREEQEERHAAPEGNTPNSHTEQFPSPSTTSSQTCNDAQPAVSTVLPTKPTLQTSLSIKERQTERADSPTKAIDVPISAINSGERRVELCFGNTAITLPVVPSTTARDLLDSISTVLLQPIDSRTSILVEVYGPLNLERPLRHYEFIRDVLNSWDSDAQNHLTIMHESDCAATGLDQTEAPSKQPGKTVVHMYHSQRPGKWGKRWLTLKADGQVTMSKERHDGDTKNIFHLSDFDVHMTTGKQKKKLKAPKDYCFAVKSQQRSVVFEKTTNFAHYFSTSDKSVADCWYHAVHAWRSWYLVSRLGEGGAPQLQLDMDVSGPVPAQGSPSTPQSDEAIPCQLGTSKTMIDFSVDAWRYEDIKITPPPSPPNPNVRPPRQARLLHETSRGKLRRDMRASRYHPPSFNHTTRPLIHTVRNKNDNMYPIRPSVGDGEAGFTGNGLLGRLPSQSVKKMRSIEGTENGFTGRGLLARQMSTNRYAGDAHFLPQNMDDAFTGSGLVSRSVTRKRSQVSRPGQPLVDLSTRSEFVNGSLLQQVESFDISHGAHLRAIDRSRGTEVMDRTGEF